jgi:Ca2+-transporting ATPase
VHGRGIGIVTATGMSTEMGKIANLLLRDDNEKTPLQKKACRAQPNSQHGVLGVCAFIFALTS